MLLYSVISCLSDPSVFTEEIVYSFIFFFQRIMNVNSYRLYVFTLIIFFFYGIKQNSVNAGVPKIPYPWLVFNEKIKVNSVFLRDSTGVSDSVLLMFGGSISSGGLVCSIATS